MKRPNRGLFIVFEGVNGSSKTSTIHEIEKYALKYGSVKVYKFPDRKGYLGDDINRFLRKEKQIDSTYDRLHMFAENRYAYLEEMIQTLEEGITILCDRYIYSAIVYQLPLHKELNDIHIYSMSYIVSYFDKFCMKPDIVFLMDANFLESRRDHCREKYHYENEEQTKIRSYFKKVLSLCNVEYYIINPVYNNIEETASLVMNIIDRRYYSIATKEINFLYQHDNE